MQNHKQTTTKTRRFLFLVNKFAPSLFESRQVEDRYQENLTIKGRNCKQRGSFVKLKERFKWNGKRGELKLVLRQGKDILDPETRNRH